MASTRNVVALHAEAQGKDVPLCVALNGTLIRSDLLFESLLLLLKKKPLCVFLLPWWLIRGRAVLKAEISSRVTLNPSALPYNQEILKWLKAEHADGRHLWLCTGTATLLAQGVATHLGVFDGVIACDSQVNLGGSAKAQELIRRFGKGAFDYCGRGDRDAEALAHARGAVLVDPVGPGREATNDSHVLQEFRTPRAGFASLLRALRPHQWVKNVLVLVPLLAAHRVSGLDSVITALLAVVAFCLCASSVYVLNDLLDLEADRAHPRKQRRPFAAGDLPIAVGIVMAPALLLGALSVALLLPPAFVLAISIYYLATLAYSFVIKGLVLLDVIALASLYTIRIIAGALALSIPLSSWLLLFSLFLFFSLAVLKRFAELEALSRQHGMRARGRGYTVGDLPLLQGLGTASGYMSIVVLALYINSPEIEALYRRPTVIWLLCVQILYWTSHMWLKAQRGEMHDDPIVFAFRDRASLALAILAAITLGFAL